jgi:hypothetical protein
MEFHSDLDFFLSLLVIATMYASALLALGAVTVGIWYSRSESALARRVYWAVFCITVVGIVASGRLGVAPRALFGPLAVDPSRSRQSWSDIEYFNVLTTPLLAVFFSVPYWRRRRPSPGTLSTKPRGPTLR